MGDLGLIPGWGRSPGGRHGNPLQYSCLENPHGQRSLAGYSPRGTDMPERQTCLSQTRHTAQTCDMCENVHCCTVGILKVCRQTKCLSVGGGIHNMAPVWCRSSTIVFMFPHRGQTYPPKNGAWKRKTNTSKYSVIISQINRFKVKAKVAQSGLTLCNPIDYTVPGVLQAKSKIVCDFRGTINHTRNIKMQ